MKLVIFLIFTFLTGCIGGPSGGGNDATCESGYNFDAVRRKCTFSGGMSPEATLGQVETNEDEQSLIFLNYNKVDGKLAVRCIVESDDLDVEYVSPALVNVVTYSEQLNFEARAAYLSIPTVGSFATQKADALIASNNAKASLDQIKLASKTITILAALESLINSSRAAGEIAQAITENTSTYVQGRITLDKVEEVDRLRQSVADRCDCSQGECKTLAKPKEHFFGESEFHYYIIDQLNRRSLTKEVINKIKGINDLPIAASFTVRVDESQSENPNSYNFTVPLAKDVEDNLNAANFHYEVVSAPTKGYLSNCLGYNSTSFQDRNCDYTPINGDLNGEGTKSSFSFNGINFVAAAPGPWGDGVKVEFLLKSGVANTPEIYVDGRTITIYIEQGITTALNVFAALLNDNFASTLLDFETSIDLLASSLTSANAFPIVRTEFLSGGSAPHDTIEYRVFDGKSYSQFNGVIGIKVTPESDPPRMLLSQMTPINFDEDTIPDNDTSDAYAGITIKWEDPEGDNLNSCTLTIEDSNFIQLRACECVDVDPYSTTDLAECSFMVMPKLNVNGTFATSLKVRITSIDGLYDEQYIPVSINSINDAPLPAMINTAGMVESKTAFPDSYSFTIPSAFDQDATGSSVYTYSLSDGPYQGTLSNCLGLNGSDLTDLSCDYIPHSGNLTKVGEKSNQTFDDLLFTAKFSGDFGNNITFAMETDNSVEPQKAIISNDGLDFTIRFSTITAQNLKAQIEDPNVSLLLPRLIDIEIIGPAAEIQTSQTRRNLSGGRNGADFFKYTVSDGITPGVSEGFVGIDIYPTNDSATICQYSKFSDAPECGVKGCFGDLSPVNRIIPSSVGIKYYHKGEAVCYESNGTSNSANWEIISDTSRLISDQQINEKDVLVIDEIRIDEGGGSARKDACSLGHVICIESADTNQTKKECRGAGSPDSTDLNIIIQASDAAANEKILFFDSLNNQCYIYDDTTTSWGLASDAGDLDVIVNEDDQEIVIFNISSSNTNLIPIENITFEWKCANIPGVTCPQRRRVIDPLTDTPTEAVPWRFGDPYDAITPRVGLSDDDFPFKIFIQPQLGQIYNATSATSTIKFELADAIGVTIGDKIEIEFDVTVNAVAAIHNGWNKISALGPKINKNAAVLDVEPVCTFHRDQCSSGGECKGAGNPETLDIIPDDTAAIYYDTANDKCYFSTGPGSASLWSEFSTFCSISHDKDRAECGGSSVSCLADGDPNGTLTSTAINTFYYDKLNNVCYRSTAADVNDKWDTYSAPGEVTIGWENFSIIGAASITGFNIFRRLANEEFDYDRPINKTLLTSSTNEYVDNSVNSFYPPIPGTTYFYEVRPFVNSILTGTNENFNIVRVLVPPHNMALVHRWMANISMCSLLNKGEIPVSEGGVDANNNYRCEYEGPGNTFVVDKGYYDFGKDLLVDRYEVGCNYSPSPACSGTFDNSCVGDESPILSAVTAPEHSLYYDRSTAQCWYRTGASSSSWSKLNVHCEYDQKGDDDPITDGAVGAIGEIFWDSVHDKCYVQTAADLSTWKEVPAMSNSILVSKVMESANSAQNPPLVHVNQKEAASLCNGASTLSQIVGVKQANLKKQLPTRKEHLVFSQWDSSSLSTSTIATMETGLSINSSSKCNSSEASGLESFYSDSPKPSSSVFYTLPGTNSSQIRSVMTGSSGNALGTFGTELCKSKFGIQDTIGNVSEWVMERMTCSSGTRCTSVSSGDALAIKDEATNKTWKKIEDNICSNSAICDSDGDGLDDPCTDSVDPVASLEAAIGTKFYNSADGSCFERVSSFRSTNNDLLVDDGIGAIGLYSAFELGESPALASGSGSTYYRGPCKDTNADDICDDFLLGWRFEEEKFDAGAMFVPMGLPVHRDFSFFNPTDLVADSISEIGPSSGITTALLHDDALYLNTHEMYADQNNCGSMVVGGSYLDGGDAGSYFFEMLPCTETDTSLVTPPVKAFKVIGDLSFKSKTDAIVQIRYDAPGAFCNPVGVDCDDDADNTFDEACQGSGHPNQAAVGDTAIQIPAPITTKYLDTDSGTCYASTGSGAGTTWAEFTEDLSLTVAGSSVVVSLGIDETGNPDARAEDILNLLQGDANFNLIAEVVISGDGNNAQSSFVENVELDSNLEDNSRGDIGFRCVMPVYDYEEDP